ncbi:transglycosylase SLT domain-containing protein [Bordetella sputigena]|uniref:transglycosylase SLT domain-containing protein n=1 Tax=Bordetella sputigena TaxID=1416810 RepID=UPI0039EE14F2
MKLFRLIFPLVLAVLAGCAGTTHKQTELHAADLDTQQPGYPTRYVATVTSRTIDLTHPPRDVWDRIRRGFAIPNLHNPLVDQWTDYYASHPEAVQRMAERAGKYLYFITDEINRRGMPTELALLPFVESAYNPSALSRAQASGLWQFVPATGQHYNLKQDWWRDERRDPIASTNAALDYLENLFEMQGDWYLALASYNWGEGSVQRAMAKNEAAGLPTDYLSLQMPDETRNYVPKLQAIKNIIANPNKYAVVLPAVDNTPYFATVQKNRDIDIEVAARLAEMPVDEFKALNPSFNRPVIRGEHASMILPADRVAVFNANMENYKGDLSSWKVYQPQRGDTYASIARRFGISEATLRGLNDIPSRQKRIAMAQHLLVPARGGVQVASLDTAGPATGSVPAQRGSVRSATAQVASAKMNAPRPNVRQHKVKSGDTLYSLARQYSTTVDALRALNNLKGNALKVGSTLRVPGTNVRG